MIRRVRTYCLYLLTRVLDFVLSCRLDHVDYFNLSKYVLQLFQDHAFDCVRLLDSYYSLHCASRLFRSAGFPALHPSLPNRAMGRLISFFGAEGISLRIQHTTYVGTEWSYDDQPRVRKYVHTWYSVVNCGKLNVCMTCIVRLIYDQLSWKRGRNASKKNKCTNHGTRSCGQKSPK